MDTNKPLTFYGNGWVATEPGAEGERVKAAGLARGDYQLNVIAGREALSGSTLRGRAGKYRGKYRQSRNNLLTQIREAGIRFDVRTINRRRVLIFKAPPDPEVVGALETIAEMFTNAGVDGCAADSASADR